MRIDLQDHVALVTGSAHRVGKAIALELAKQGVNIMVHYHSSDNAVRETLLEIKSQGVDAFAAQVDLSQPEGVEALFDAVRENYGRLNILVNSASVFNKNTLLEATLDEWQQSLDVNLTAPFLATQHAARIMRDNDPSGGSIINILDYGSVRPWVDHVDHGVSKAGLLMLTRISAIGLGSENIRVNGVLPGPVMKTPGLSDEQWREIGRRSPLGRTGTAEDVARAVAYLAGEDYITGAILEVNAGETL
jgi:NAD(P)-dependent dehydrogenase (short-subunit alcohol dehydrogenase family)